MREKNLNLIGLMRRANAIAVGETNTGTAVKAGKGKLLILASDASENAKKRAESFVWERSTMLVTVPFTKAEISQHVGLNGCSMAAITDYGFANALMKALAEQWPEEYGVTALEMAERYSRAEQRKVDTAVKRRKRNSKRRTNV